MTIQPTDLPGRLIDSATVPDAGTRIRQQQTNEFAFSVFNGEHGLPAPSMSPRPDCVVVHVADVDDLGPWLTTLGGEIHQSPVFEGERLWTLHTGFSWVGGTRIQVRVTAAVLADELVLDYIRGAVKA